MVAMVGQPSQSDMFGLQRATPYGSPVHFLCLRFYRAYGRYGVDAVKGKAEAAQRVFQLHRQRRSCRRWHDCMPLLDELFML